VIGLAATYTVVIGVALVARIVANVVKSDQ